MEYYVPDATIRILSIFCYCEYHAGQDCYLLLDYYGCHFMFPYYSGVGTISFNYCGTNYIPCATYFAQQFGTSMESRQTFMVLDNSNINLTPPQKFLLELHFYLGDLNLAWKKILSEKYSICCILQCD